MLWKCYFGSVQVVHFERMEMEVVKKPKKWLNYRLKFFQCLPGRKRICIHFWIGFVVKFYEQANSLWETLSFGTKSKKCTQENSTFDFVNLIRSTYQQPTEKLMRRSNYSAVLELESILLQRIYRPQTSGNSTNSTEKEYFKYLDVLWW